MLLKSFTKFQMIIMLIVILSTNLLAQDNINKNPNEMNKSTQTKRAVTKASPLTTNSSIIFLHHSTGRNVYNIGNVEEWFDEYNTNNNTNFSINEREYPATPYPHDNYPYDYWNLWVTENEDSTSRIPACDSENPSIECLDTLTSNYDVIIFKQCYPGAAIAIDTGSPNIASSSKRIENYKLQYRALRREMDKYPDNTFIVWTLVPLHRLATNTSQASRAKEFVDWVKNDFLTEDNQDHSNIHIFDFWGIVAEDQENPPNGQVNTIKYEYEGSHTGSDSHPNNLASQTAGPIFSQFIVDTILNAGTNLRLSNGLPDGVLPSGTTETLLSLNTNIDSVCRYSDSPFTYTEMTNTFANTNASTHSTPITGLEDEQSYAFYIKCMDADNNTNTNNYSIDFYVNSSNPASEIDIRISNFIDDAEEILSSGSVGLASSDLELVFDAEPMAVGLRFNDVEIPKNALITNAYIQFTVDEDNSEDTSLIIHGHASDNSPIFSTIDFGITTREKTAATVQWDNVPPWSGKGTISTDQRTPDLKSIVQEIVNKDNWTIHNAMAFIFTGSGKRVAISFDQNPGKAPLLHVEFKTDQTQTNDITLSNLVTTEITPESFNVSVDFEGDDNSNAVVTLYYCNNTVSNGCDPEAAPSVHMIRDNGFYATSVSGLVSPGDVFNIRIIAQDVDGVSGSPLNSSLSLTESDTTPPFSVSNTKATNGNERSVISWTNPDDNDFSGVIILQSESSINSIPTNGNIYNVNEMIGNAFVIYNHSGTTHTVTNLLNDNTYYFKIFAYDTSANYAQGIALNATPTTPQVVEGNRLTERFGGSASTLDHQDVMKDTWFSIYSPSSGNVLYHDYGKPYEVAEGMARRNAVYIDVSNIPQGTHIFKARFVIQIEPDYPLSYNSYADGLSLYKITDPSATGLWVEDDLNASYKNRTLQLPWTDQGGSFADVIDPNPIDTVYGTMQKKSFYFFDVTDLVQTWVNHPQENVGVTFDGTIPSDEKENPELRPYLEITYEAINTDRPSQPVNFNVFHRSGQNFMTWTEIDYDGYFYNMYYRIYRHTSPINNENLNDAELVGKVHQLSSFNAGRTEARKRADSSYTTQHNYVINEGENELSDDTGLFVYNVPQEGNYYYAVTSVVEGNENRTDFSEENSLNAPITDAPGFPEAILQGSTTHNGTIVQEFVHFTTASMNYRQGHGFNFMMNVSGSYSSENPTFLEIGLGGRSTRYYGTYSSNGGIYIQPDTYMPPTDNAPWDGYEYDSLQTWWSGCSNTYKTQKGIKNGVFVPYTENRILYYIEFAKNKYNIDENRIYLRGGSMGGTGTISLGLKHPEIFASLSATVGCPNWKYNIDAVDENYVVIDEGWRLNGNALWGTLADNLLHENGTPIWNWMNAGWYAMTNIEREMPFIEMNNGKKDGSVRHYAIPQFYEDMKNSKHGFAARFYDGGHSGYGSIFTPRFATIVKNESFPALRNVSIDDKVGAIHEPTGIAIVTDFESSLQLFDGDIEGTINGYYDIEWSRKLKQFDNVSDVDDMVDLNDLYEVALRLEGISDHNTATMDITPRRLQNFDVAPGQTYYWENKQLSTGTIVQSGTIIADEYGLITVPGFSIEKSTWGNKLIITADQGHQEGYLHTVNVSTVSQLQNAIASLQSNTQILVDDGHYPLSRILVIGNDVQNVALKGKSGNRDDVVIQASGMEDSAVEHAIMIRNAQDVLIADLTVRDTYYHTIMIQGEQGATHPVLRNLHLIDSGEQFIKVTYAATGEHCDNGIVENCLIEYTDNARIHPYRNDYYTQGVDVHRGSNWIIRDNIFKNIRAPHDSGMLAGAAIIMWNQSKNTIVERNRFLECDIGIQFGNPGGAENDHEFGIIRNNFFYRAPESTGDTGISLNRARNSKVYNNTIILNNTFPWTIEYRFNNTYGEIVGDIRYNLSDGPILSRNDAPGSEIGNITTAESTWFKDSMNGDLHLVSSATDAIDNALLLPEVMDDIDNDQRIAPPDIGADEYLDDTPPPQTDLIQPSDLIYKGAFRLPGPSNGISWGYAGGSSYGGGDMTYYPDGDSAQEDTDGYPGSIFGIGKAYDLNYVSEISIPVPVISPDKDVNDLNTATTLQPFTDIRSFELGASTPTTTAIEYLPAQVDQETGKLYSSWGEYYQFSGGFLSQSWSELDLSNPQTKGGWFLGDGQIPHNMSISGYMFTIPKDWSDIHTPGKLLVTGRYSTAEFGSGPSLYAFGPWNHGNPPEPDTQLDATCLMQYTFNERFNDYTGVDRWMGGAWLTSGKKSAVVLTGIKSIGDSWYGYENGTRMEECTYHNPPGNVDCSVLGQRGWWAEDYDGRILFYNPDDFAAVVKGEKQPYEPQPYVVINVDDYLFHLGTGNHEDARIGGASYDRERGYLYVFEFYGDGNKPLVHVWEVDKKDKIKHTLSDAIHLLRMLSGFSDNAAMVRDINFDSRVGLAEMIYVLQDIVKMSNMEEE
ncbi:secreted protein containing Peptidase S9, prolyl oligopeptidase active site region domain protein [Candidatus Magnetomorum sp. HK-1]|nr:secreted protein containing Peptidase S9, prolyl oligopeptidase active site region domain protein [Candidatus Magnetomorum sp. HK-1]